MGIKRNLLNKLAAGVLSAGMLLGVVTPAFAQDGARNASWTVSITYQNIGSDDTPVTLNLYQEGSGNVAATLLPDELPNSNPLPAGAATSFFVGDVDDPDFSNGNGVMSSEQPLAATVVQFSQDEGYRMRLLYNGFPDSKSASQYLVATTLFNRFGRTTVFSVQNTESSAIDVNIKFYDADNNGNLASEVNFTIPASSSRFIAMDDPADTGLPANLTTFNGSAIVTAELQGSDTPAEVVAAASEYYVNTPVATNFEGQPLSDAANQLYMATALCQRFGLDTFYAIQNASLTEDASVVITYYNLDGTVKATSPAINIGPGQKSSPHSCDVNGDQTIDPDMQGFTGSSVIVSTGAPIVAIGKAQGSPQLPVDPRYQDVLTAFLGESSGYQEISLPFVRWANDDRFNASTGGQQRSFIAIQNVGDTQVDDVVISYNDVNGNPVATQTVSIPARSKFNTDANSANALGQNNMNPGEFGYYTNGGFGGGVIITAPVGAQLIAIARVQNPGAGEDYNGVEIP